MRGVVAFSLLALSACATEPLAPDTNMDPRGRWTVVAVDGEATPGGTGFAFTIEPPRGSARFGCNSGSGDLAVERGYLVTGNWVVTAAACQPERMRFEHKGFDILAQPVAIEVRSAGRIRLSNRRGSIDLVRAPQVAPSTVAPVQVVPDLATLIIGQWVAMGIDGRPVGQGDRFSLTVTPTTIRTEGVCNDVRGDYRIVAGRLMPNGSPWPWTERGCYNPAGKRAPMALDDRVHAAFWNGPTITMPTPDRLLLASARGSIEFERQR